MPGMPSNVGVACFFKKEKIAGRMNIKKIIVTVMIFVIHILSSDVSAGTITGSAHDFSKNVLNESGVLCRPCHTPHQTKKLPLPLWNPELPTETYTLYESTQLPSKDANAGIRPNGSSKVCLSCHDGTVAFENFGDIPDGKVCFHGKESIGTDLGNDHPISFVYDTSLSVADGRLYDPSAKLSGILGSSGTINDDMLFQGRMECSSCHDVHNTRAVAGTKLLLKDNAGSALCLTCHDK
jgi:predicted CXXCH cytochrome family protein